MEPKILIVEDETMVAEDLSRSLKSAGYEITARASSGEEAIRIVEESEPNVVLIDINLQGEMDGIEAAESIRKRHDIPVVYLTAFAAEDVLDRAKKTEPYGFLRKPVRSVELISTIETTLYKHEADRRVRASEHELRLITDSLGALLAHVDSQQRYVWANRAYGEFFGLSSSEIQGKHVRDVLGDKTYSSVRHYIRRALSGENVSFETSAFGESEEVKHFSATYVPHVAPDGTVQGVFVQAIDITDRKEAEEALNRLNRELRALSNCNQALVRAEEEQALLNDICRIICDTAGYRMAWVGYAETDEAKNIRPVAWAGAEDGYLEQAGLTWSDTERGRSPSGTAIRSGKIACIQDFTTDPRVVPWRENALQRGYRCCIALPLKDESANTFGVLTIYSGEPNTFTTEEESLLEELSGDLAFGVSVLRTRAERERSKEALSQSEAKLKQAARIAHVGYWDRDYVAETITLSDEACRIFGLPQDFRSPTLPQWHVQWQNLIHPEDRPKAVQAAGDALAGGPPYDVEYRVVRPDGEVRTVYSYADVTIDESGKPIRMFGTMMDITERKAMEQALAAREQQYRTLVENIPDFIVRYDTDLRRIYVNPAWERASGVTAGEVTKVPSADIPRVPRSINIEYLESLRQVLTTGISQEVEFTWTTAYGVTLFLEYLVVPEFDQFGEIASLLCVGRDLTDRKKAEDALQQSETQLRTTFENASIGVCLVGTDGRFLRVNRTMCELLGYTEEELCQMGFNDITHDDDRDIGTTFVSRALSGEVDTTSFEKRYIHKSGEVVWTQVSSTVLRTPTGESQYFITHVQDITERRRAEERLRLLDFALDHVHEAAFLIDANSQLRFVNEESCRKLGYTRSELLGLGVSDVDPDFPIERWLTHWDDLKAEGSLLFEGRHKAKDGTIFPVEISANYFEYGDQGYNLALVRDISERKQAELERLSNLRFFESMDLVNRAIQGSHDLEQMMSDVLDTVLSIFDCDRTFLLYPCDPQAATWTAPMERTKPEWPGVLALGLEMPMDADVAETLRILLASDGPVKFGPSTEHSLPAEVSETFGIKSFMSMAFHPKVEKPWQFGIHQCSHPRVWTSEEERLFQEIGRRLADGLSVLLAHRNLQESERRYREIFENTSDAIFLLDVTLDGCLVFRGLSPAAERMTGLSDQELTGRFVEDLIPENISVQFMANCRQCIESGTVMEYEEELDLPFGSKWIHTTLNPVRDLSGRIYRIVVVGRDISAIRLAERELQRTNDLLRAIIEAAPTAIIGLDLDGNVRDVWNPAAEKMLGWSAREVMGRPLPSVSVEKQEEFRGFRERIRSGKSLDGVEVSRLKRDGTPIDYSIYASPLYDTEGRITGNIAVLVDITQRKKSERILKARLALSDYAYAHTLDELLQKTLDIAESLTNSQIGFFHFLEADQKTLSLQMWSTDTLEKMCTAEGKTSHYPVEQAGVWVDCIHQRGPVIHNDYEALPHRKGMPPGHARVTRELVVPVFQGDAIVAIVGVGNKPSEYIEADIEVVSQLAEMAWDIVVRKIAEESLRRRDEFLTNIMESLTHPFYIVNADDHTIQMSNRAALASGIPEGTTCYSATHGQTVPCGGADHPCPMEILKATGQPTMVEHVHHDEEGRPRNIEVYAYPIPDSEGRVKQIIEYCLDVTDRTQAQQALLESERTLKTILSLSPSGIGYFRGGRLTWANRAMMELFGYREDEQEDFFGTSPRRFYESDEEYDRVRAFLRSELGERRPAEVEARFRRKDGSIFIGSMAVSAPIFDHREMGTTVVISDITTRKAAEEERARLVTVIEQSAESIVVTDRAGTIQYVNPAFEKLTKYTADEAVGQNPRILKSGKHDDRFYREMWETLTRGDIWRGHLVNKRKDGSLFEEEATISPVRDESGNIVNYVALKRDVTAQVLLEKQLHQAQKMESIGTLAGGIAHDFNNLLQVVLGYADMLMIPNGKHSPDLQSLEIIRKTAKDGGELVKGLLTFSRQVESKMRPTDLNVELKRVRTMLRRTIPRMVEIEFLLADDLAAVNADPVQVEQVLLNLCVNAHHAMPKGGKLTIETGNVTLDEEYCKKHLDVRPGEYVLLKITDNGHGMEREIVERIFEPFFTTKKAGEGTGLGLAIVYGIVKNHGGHIACYSEPGQGTTFKIYIPAIVTEVEPGVAETAGKMLPFGTETILVVDDEQTIRRMTEQILTRSGYKVFTASNGAEAVEIYRRRKDEIDLVVLDLIMPEMGGEQCLEEILKIDPQAKVLVASGYLEGRPTSELLNRGAAGFVDKPFEMREFLLVLRQILDQTGFRRSPVQASEDISPGSDEDDRTASAAPLPPAEAPQAHERPTPGMSPRSLRILAIDDREPYLRMLEAGLLQFGHTPLTASSGAEGLRTFRESPADLVICDLGMPDLDGWEVSKRIKEICQEKAVPKTPFILLTGRAEKEETDQDEREKMTDCGVDAIAGKPMDIPDLLKVAEKLLRERSEDSD